MQKPHEQEWTVRVTNNGPTVYRTPDDAVCMVYYPSIAAQTWVESDAAGKALGDFISAAPDMARALLANGHTLPDGSWHEHRCRRAGGFCTAGCQRSQNALRKAGVL